MLLVVGLSQQEAPVCWFKYQLSSSDSVFAPIRHLSHSVEINLFPLSLANSVRSSFVLLCVVSMLFSGCSFASLSIFITAALGSRLSTHSPSTSTLGGRLLLTSPSTSIEPACFGIELLISLVESFLFFF